MRLVYAIAVSLLVHSLIVGAMFVMRGSEPLASPKAVVRIVSSVPKKDGEKKPRVAAKGEHVEPKRIERESGIFRTQPAIEPSSGEIDLSVKTDPGFAERLDANAGKEGRQEGNERGWKAKVARDGRVKFEDDASVQLRGFSPTFDLTDGIMRMRGDLLHGYEKRQFLDKTREKRIKMAQSARGDRLNQALLDLQPRLIAIWDDEHISLNDKKRQLFALWDECAEDGPVEVVNMSQLMRMSILRFVAAKLPAHSELAYTKEELEALNRTRRSRDEFAP